MYGKYDYLHLGENIDPEKFIITEFYVESDLKLLEVAEAIAAESSVGTWTELSTMNPNIFHNFAARVFYANDEEGIIKIAYPLALFEGGNIPQLLSDVAGNVYGLKEVKNLRVRDIALPEKYVASFAGPAFGVEGIQKILEVKNRPLLGSIIKPKVGLSADEHSKVAYEAWVGGIDIIKDDENLSNQSFNPFEERIVKTVMMKKKAEDETGHRKIYVPNISASVTDMMRRAEFVKAQGGEAVMMDILTVGFSGVEYIRNQNLGLILHGHRAMHGAFTHGTKHGIAMLPIAKLARLAGIDQLHTGTVIGKMEGSSENVHEINDAMREPWYSVKSTMPIASGGLHPGHIPRLIELLGNDVIINFGGGIHGHPGGTRVGAKAALQAVEATIKGIDIKTYAKDHAELAKAIETWGIFEDKVEKKNNSIVTYTYGLASK